MLTSDVFLTYRSDDDPFASALAEERLRLLYGDRRVFRDCRNLHMGTEFKPELWAQLIGCRILVVLIGSRWLTLKDEFGVRLLDRPDDFVRREIAEALDRPIAVIPVLLNDAAPPRAIDLPDDIQALGGSRFLRLRERFSEVDLHELTMTVSRVVPPQIPVASERVSRNSTTLFG